MNLGVFIIFKVFCSCIVCCTFTKITIQMLNHRLKCYASATVYAYYATPTNKYFDTIISIHVRCKLFKMHLLNG